jgi:hypothetical protein
VNFLVNIPESGEIFGTNRGLPASETALAAAELDPLSQQVKDYEASIADASATPRRPIVGYGTLEEKFRQLGNELELRHHHRRRRGLAVLLRDGRRPQPVETFRGPDATSGPGTPHRPHRGRVDVSTTSTQSHRDRQKSSRRDSCVRGGRSS